MIVKKEQFPGLSGKILAFMPSFIKKGIYKIKGYKIGKNVKFGLGSYINGKNINIGDNTKIGMFTIIFSKNFKTGKNVEIGAMNYINTPIMEIGDNTILREQLFIGGLITHKSRLFIGKRVRIFQYTVLNVSDNLIIEDDVGIGGRCLIFTHGTWQSMMDGYPGTFGPVIIKQGAWLPWQVFVLPGITIGKCSTIGGGSLVTKDIPDYSLAIGNPARIIKQKPDYPKKLKNHQKRDLLINIIEDFFNYLKFSDIRTEMTKKKDTIYLKIYLKKIYSIIVYLNSVNYNEKCDCIISLNKINYKKLNNKESYFDIDNKKFRGNNEIINEISEFFFRFGILFNEE